MQHQEEISRLARQKYFPQMIWRQGIAGQVHYALTDGTVYVEHVLYNQKVLRYVTEQTLDYSGNRRSWESNTGEPTYWTDSNQGPNIIRIIPPPLRDGSSVPTATLLPLYQDLQDNLLIFTYEDPGLDITNMDSILPTLLDWEDILVFSTVYSLAMQEKTDQNLALAQNCEKLIGLWQSLLEKNGG